MYKHPAGARRKSGLNRCPTHPVPATSNQPPAASHQLHLHFNDSISVRTSAGPPQPQSIHRDPLGFGSHPPDSSCVILNALRRRTSAFAMVFLTTPRRPRPSSNPATPASHAKAQQLPRSEKKRLNGTWKDGQWWCKSKQAMFHTRT